MRFFRTLLVVGLFLLLASRAKAEDVSENEALPPEKTQIIYDTLLPKEGDEQDESGTNDAAAQRAPDAGMTPERIAKILGKKDVKLRGDSGRWQFIHEGMQVFLLTDLQNNRMRLMSPLAKLDLLRQDPNFDESDLLQKMLKANYLASGDVRLCVNKNVIWAAFLHPLDSLTERDLVSALGQLAETVRKTRGDID